MSKINIFWFRRDLRLDDNAAFSHALKTSKSVLPLFIFDSEILDRLEVTDPRVTFIHQTLKGLKNQLQKQGGDLLLRSGPPLQVWQTLARNFQIDSVYANHDYEPSARHRDEQVADFLASKNIAFKTFKDQCLFEKDEILSGSGTPYTVYTPYKKKVLSALDDDYLKSYPVNLAHLHQVKKPDPLIALSDLGFQESNFSFPNPELKTSMLKKYSEQRNFPALESGTSRLGIHLRFGTLSVRDLARRAQKYSETWLSELIWRDFFMQILWHFPRVEKKSFRLEYEQVAWRTSRNDFQRWAAGETGFPLVDAGMRELNQTGYMHNRVRMITASFFTKHLLRHWFEGERYFAKKLLDYDLAANNGNWQWAAGTGCDAAPYFRIFNPTTQIKKFDPNMKYIKKWVPELGTSKYPSPMVDHAEARERALREYRLALAHKRS
jgi:deoxyribodipyrimidine photo-lyase